MRLIYVAGKGGVGKSVTSAATGMWASRQGKETLAFSMDPAHSLSDIFEIDLGSKPTKIGDRLSGYEPDLHEESRSFYRRYKSMLTALFGLFEMEVKPDDFGNMPGVNELIFMDKLYDVIMEKKYEVIVIDSAPTAMVLPLLQLPSVTTGFVTRVLGVRKKWMGVLNMLESGFGDAVLNEVRAMRMKAETMRTVLIDPKIATITVVTIPEKAAVLESRRLINTVEDHGVNVNSIVINHVMGTSCRCDYCLHKRESQLNYIDELKKDYSNKLVATLPDYAGEVKGTGLEQVVRDLYEKGQLTI